MHFAVKTPLFQLQPALGWGPSARVEGAGGRKRAQRAGRVRLGDTFEAQPWCPLSVALGAWDASLASAQVARASILAALPLALVSSGPGLVA